MAEKRLRSSKKTESSAAAQLSRAAKIRLSEAVRGQFIETMKLPAEYGDVSVEINTMGYSILRTGHDMNEYFEVVSGEKTYNNEKTEICGTVSDLCKRSANFFGRKDIALLCKVPQEKIFVQIDRECFYYALLDLLLNAAENTFRRGRVRVSVTKTTKFAKITVGDNGCGMDEETKNHCLEPFFTKNNFGGQKKMGLGLTLARHFVSENGGRINVSTEKGKGTAVSLLIPLMDSEKAALWAEAPVPDILGGKFSPVLIMLSGIGKD